MKHTQGKWEDMYKKIDEILLTLQRYSRDDKYEPDKLLLHRERARKQIHWIYNESHAELLEACRVGLNALESIYKIGETDAFQETPILKELVSLNAIKVRIDILEQAISKTEEVG